MAFNPIGVVNWLDKADAAQVKKREEEDAREALAFELTMKYGVDGLAKSTGTKSKKLSVESAELAEKVLMKKYGISSDVLAPLIASDKNAPSKLLTILDGQEAKYGKTGRSIPEARINEILESAIAQQPEDSKVNFEKIEKFIGRPLDSLYRQMLEQAEASSGEVYFSDPEVTEQPTFISDPEVTEQPTFTELGQIPKTIAQWQQAGALREQAILTARVAEIRDMPAAEQEALGNEGKLISDRLDLLKEALDKFESNPALLIQLYGNSYGAKLMEMYPRYDGYVPETFIDARFSYPLVASEEMAVMLLQRGIIAAGTVVRLPSGELIELSTETQPQ
jgi:hypothetical protein